MGPEVIQRRPDKPKLYPLGSAVDMEWSTWKWYLSSLCVDMGIYWLVTGCTYWVKSLDSGISLSRFES